MLTESNCEDLVNVTGVADSVEVLEKGGSRDRVSSAERAVLRVDSYFLAHTTQIMSHIFFLSPGLLNSLYCR